MASVEESRWIIKQIASNGSLRYYWGEGPDIKNVRKVGGRGTQIKASVADDFIAAYPDRVITVKGSKDHTGTRQQSTRRAAERKLLKAEKFAQDVKEEKITMEGFKPCGRGKCRSDIGANKNQCRNMLWDEYKLSVNEDKCIKLPLENGAELFRLLLKLPLGCFTNRTNEVKKLLIYLKQNHPDLYNEKQEYLTDKFSPVLKFRNPSRQPFVITPVNPYDIRTVNNLNCIKKSAIQLRPHQLRPIAYLQTNRGILVVHGTGTGKTLLAIGAAQCFLESNPLGKILIVCPPAVKNNFLNSLEIYGVDNVTIEQNYLFYSFDNFVKQNLTPNENGIFLIIDEAHNIRNQTGSTRSRETVKNSFAANKVLLLTATPFVNNFADFLPIINIIHGEKDGQQAIDLDQGKKLNKNIPVDSELFLESLNTLKFYLDKRVDFYNSTKDFPKVNLNSGFIPMSSKYLSIYSDLLKGKSTELREIYTVLSGDTNLPLEVVRNEMNVVYSAPEKFYNGCRRLVNSLVKSSGQLHQEWYFYTYYASEKIKAAVNIIKSSGNKKSVIFSNWVEQGTYAVKKLMEMDDYLADKFAIFNGNTPEAERINIVQDYNNDLIQVLIISKAGSEGLDLKGTNNIIIIDPPWNQAGIDQIIGRGARYKSHIHLPKEEQKVDVFLLLLITEVDKRDISDDDIITTKPNLKLRLESADIPSSETKSKWSTLSIRKTIESRGLSASEPVSEPVPPPVSEPVENIPLNSEVKSGDVLLYKIIQQKKQVNIKIMELLESMSIGNGGDIDSKPIVKLIKDSKKEIRSLGAEFEAFQIEEKLSQTRKDASREAQSISGKGDGSEGAGGGMERRKSDVRDPLSRLQELVPESTDLQREDALRESNGNIQIAAEILLKKDSLDDIFDNDDDIWGI